MSSIICTAPHFYQLGGFFSAAAPYQYYDLCLILFFGSTLYKQKCVFWTLKKKGM
jgi:hypothetical protein